ncbi:MAG: homocysteine S-methyltransferase family protein [Planctomycetes bacterium]|nr:homocysteine S-methyltransferase family protein [Planctomycetota bacterium]
MGKGILERLRDGIVLGDGGYIIELERRGYVIAGAFTPELAVTHPDAVREMHREFLSAGAEVLQVMAFYGSREKLATVGKGDRTFEINRAATRLAREVAGDKALVAGDLSATWKWADTPSARSLVAGMFDEQIEAQEGVDFFIGETFWHFGEALLCLERIKAKSKVPAMITVAFRGSLMTDDGATAADCAKRLSVAGAEIVGTNCMRDPERMYPVVEAMRQATDGFLAAQPVAFRCSDEVPWFTGTPAFPDKLDPTQLTRFEMADFARKAKAMGVNYIGSCCGSIATHVREMARALGRYQESQVWKPDPKKPMSETEFNWERRQAKKPAGKGRKK